MDRLVRTFVGLRCGARARTRLHARALALRDGEPVLRVPVPEDLHLTLQFLGDTPQTELGRVGKALVAAARDVPPIQVRYRGLGAFPDAARARVVWAGVEEEVPAGHLERLVLQVGRALDHVGFPPERRRFHAHVTLARLRGRPPPRVVEELASAGQEDLGSEILSELKLILSDPASRTYHYIDLTTVHLGGPSA